VLQTIRRLLIRSEGFRLERELPGGICTHDINAPWQGTQWNKIEHRLFSFISQNWRAQPLVSYRVIVDLISATTTKTGLTVRCELDTGQYPSGIVVSDAEMAAINIKRAEFHGEWNYTISPNAYPPDCAFI
jgi:Rhodopirellula transposase DDE domain